MSGTEEIKVQEEKKGLEENVKKSKAMFESKLNELKKSLDKLKGALDKLTMYTQDLKDNN